MTAVRSDKYHSTLRMDSEKTFQKTQEFKKDSDPEPFSIEVKAQ